VKSLREGSASLEDAYARSERGEVWLLGATSGIRHGQPDEPQAETAAETVAAPPGNRQIAGKASERGFTLGLCECTFAGGEPRSSWPCPRQAGSRQARRPQKSRTPSAISEGQCPATKV